MARPAIPWAGSALALGVVLLFVAYGLGTLDRRVRFDLAPGEVEPAVGQSFVVQLKGRPGWPWVLPGDQADRLARSDLRLHEDGRPLGPPQAQHADIRDGGGGFSHWQRSLLFSTPDHSDPRTNGRVYTVTATARLAPAIIDWTLAIGSGGVLLGLGLLAWRQRTCLLAAVRRRAAHLWRRRWDYAAAGAFPAAVGVFAWLALPPIWNGSDSVIWLLWPWNLFPHHPILYPTFMAFATTWFAESRAVLSFATAVQHLAAIGALIYLASAFRARRQIVIVSVLACLGTALQLYAQGLMTEALDLSFLCILLGAVLRLRRDGMNTAVGAALFVGLLGGLLTRHASIVFAAIPLAYVLIAALWSEQRWSRSAWRPVGGVIAVVLLALVTAKGLTGSACHLIENRCLSTIGRPGVYRIVDTYQLVPQEARAAWLERLAGAAPDVPTAQALVLMAQTPNPWLGTRRAIAAEPDLWSSDPDVLMNTGFLVFARSLDGDALRQWGRELNKAVFGPVAGVGFGNGQFETLLRMSADSIRVVFPPEADALRVLQGTGAEHPESATRYLNLANLPATRLLDLLLPLAQGIRVPLLLAAWLLAFTALRACRRADFTALLLSLWIGFAAYALALTLVTVVLPRYLAPLDLLLWLSNAIAISALIDQARRRRRSGALPRRGRED
ncbi:MAG: hypothetical protein JZU52_02445 [Lamprocystis purpurea]|uniref:hypothetical protein n=1 Tax=Lamprocystis purpurea TaxID=61598 RepID=UPI0012FBF95E|nr:hypothetical protein [Lamprocystis purpurea]MBV5272533.1 hypothetical protein [Lamprocystis purpurea]